MRIITRKPLLEFAQKHPTARSGLDHWYRVMKRTTFDNLVELRRAFPSADPVGKLTVFNIANKARLIAAIHYNGQRVYVRHVLTHEEYDQGKWKEP